MISYNTILSNMEDLLQGAKHASSEQHLREQIAAIRALCDVVMQNEVQSTIQTMAVQQQSNIHVSPASVTSNQLQEQDANGDSIFDF